MGKTGLMKKLIPHFILFSNSPTTVNVMKTARTLPLAPSHTVAHTQTLTLVMCRTHPWFETSRNPTSPCTKSHGGQAGPVPALCGRSPHTPRIPHIHLTPPACPNGPTSSSSGLSSLRTSAICAAPCWLACSVRESRVNVRNSFCSPSKLLCVFGCVPRKAVCSSTGLESPWKSWKTRQSVWKSLKTEIGEWVSWQ